MTNNGFYPKEQSDQGATDPTQKGNLNQGETDPTPKFFLDRW